LFEFFSHYFETVLRGYQIWNQHICKLVRNCWGQVTLLRVDVLQQVHKITLLTSFASWQCRVSAVKPALVNKVKTAPGVSVLVLATRGFN
jgi:hypothetical protein